MLQLPAIPPAMMLMQLPAIPPAMMLLLYVEGGMTHSIQSSHCMSVASSLRLISLVACLPGHNMQILLFQIIDAVNSLLYTQLKNQPLYCSHNNVGLVLYRLRPSGILQTAFCTK